MKGGKPIQDGIAQPVETVIDTDNSLPYGRAIGECDRAHIAFKVCVDDKTWGEAGTDGTDIPYRRPYVRDGRGHGSLESNRRTNGDAREHRDGH